MKKIRTYLVYYADTMQLMGEVIAEDLRDARKKTKERVGKSYRSKDFLIKRNWGLPKNVRY
jgi:hypothetical protein